VSAARQHLAALQAAGMWNATSSMTAGRAEFDPAHQRSDRDRRQ